MRKAFAITAVAAAFTFLPVTTTLAQSPSDNENQVDTWCEEGTKYDNLSGQTFTIPQPPSGSVWTKLILNGGQDGSPAGNVRSFVVEPVPAVGTVVTRPGAEVSNAILCYEPGTDTTTSTTTTTTEHVTTTTTEHVTTTTAPNGSVTTPPPASPPELPATGTSSWGLSLAALAALIGGVGMMKLSRRRI